MARTIHEGGCMCGAVRYRLTGPFTYSAHCHCRSCQRAVGAGVATYTAVAPENFAVTRGELTVYRSSPGVERGFCSRCGTSLTYAGEDWTDTAVMSATLDDPAAAVPTSNVYLAHRQPWVALDKRLKAFDRFP
ncbi:GFA family protein [Defluviimonas sp. WL0024]|uniref:GFA family protein n=2 Tax=Albidovulum TaxID=205889 RepID=A0ABT3J305_9RHOB|nr:MULTISPECIES: GFA family protein [Defluviimonas]MCU9847716.1 GFA family protein [Defluviimonas sp. WL0024]MCW3781855.1 GFA family protein [Defluviimonas salinarum]